MQTSPSSESGPARRLDALARRAGWALIWERVWPPLAWSGALVALFLAASWFGLWFAAPRLARIGGLALFALALAAALAPLARLRRPSRAQALARLDVDAQERASAGLRLRRQARQRNGRRDDERALGAAPGAARAAPRRPLVGPSGARHGQARSARVAICRDIARARRRLARRIGALRARRRRVRLARRDRQRRSGAHRRVDRSARLHQQTAAAVEDRRAGKAGKRRYAGEFGAHRARGPPAGRNARRRRSDALDAGGAEAGRRRAERASLRHPRRRQIHPAPRRLALGRLRDFGDALRQADDRVDRPAAIEPRRDRSRCIIRSRTPMASRTPRRSSRCRTRPGRRRRIRSSKRRNSACRYPAAAMGSAKRAPPAISPSIPGRGRRSS